MKISGHQDGTTQEESTVSEAANPGPDAAQTRVAAMDGEADDDQAPPLRAHETVPNNDVKIEEKDSKAEGTDEDPQRPEENPPPPKTRITFDAAADSHPKNDVTLYIPGPRDRDRGDPLVELDKKYSFSHDCIVPDGGELDTITRVPSASRPAALRRRRTEGLRLVEAKSLDRVATVASSVFVLGAEKKPPAVRRPSQSQPALNDRPFLSRQVTIGRNSQFQNMTSEDREALGGIEYRSLKLLLKIVVGK